MELIIGKNTYISLVEANNYVDKFLLSSDPKGAAWKELTDDDKSIYLYNSLLEIESLPFLGRKLFKNQKLCFPRTKGVYYESIDLSNQELYSSKLSEDIKLAQIKNALAMLNVKENEDRKHRKALQNDGVTGFSLDGFSESYVLIMTDMKITDKTVIYLLEPWLFGGFEIE